MHSAAVAERRALHLWSQAAGLFSERERATLLQAGTLQELALEAEHRLLLAGQLPWWPRPEAGGDGPAWVSLASTDLVLMRAAIRERGRYYPAMRAIVLREDLHGEQAEQTLFHELIHAERDHSPATSRRRSTAPSTMRRPGEHTV